MSLQQSSCLICADCGTGIVIFHSSRPLANGELDELVAHYRWNVGYDRRYRCRPCHERYSDGFSLGLTSRAEIVLGYQTVLDRVEGDEQDEVRIILHLLLDEPLTPWQIINHKRWKALSLETRRRFAGQLNNLPELIACCNCGEKDVMRRMYPLAVEDNGEVSYLCQLCQPLPSGGQ